MIHKYQKYFTIFGFEKIAEWLNSMSDKGLQLVKADYFTYYFEDGIPGEYYYAVELVTRSVKKDSDYFNFLEELKIERIPSPSAMTVYRRRTKEGEFNLYNDLGPLIKHFRTASLPLFIILVSQFIILASTLRSYFSIIGLFPTFNLLLIITINVVLITFIILVLIKIELTIHRLKKERILQG